MTAYFANAFGVTGPFINYSLGLQQPQAKSD